jgi:hypothetical protein
MLEGVTILRSIVERGCDSRFYSSEKKKNTTMTKDDMGGGDVSGILFDVEVAVRGNGPSSSSTTTTATSTQMTMSLSGGFGQGRNARGTIRGGITTTRCASTEGSLS